MTDYFKIFNMVFLGGLRTGLASFDVEFKNGYFITILTDLNGENRVNGNVTLQECTFEVKYGFGKSTQIENFVSSIRCNDIINKFVTLYGKPQKINNTRYLLCA